MGESERYGNVQRLRELRRIIWPGLREEVWSMGGDARNFCAPRTLPLLFRILDSKRLRGDKDVSRTFLDLISRHRGEGIVEIENERDHAYASGFDGNERGVKSWRERMRILERLGFIRLAPKGSNPYGYALLLDPEPGIERLRKQGRVSDGDWNLYHSMRLRLDG